MEVPPPDLVAIYDDSRNAIAPNQQLLQELEDCIASNMDLRSIEIRGTEGFPIWPLALVEQVLSELQLLVCGDLKYENERGDLRDTATDAIGAVVAALVASHVGNPEDLTPLTAALLMIVFRVGREDFCRYWLSLDR